MAHRESDPEFQDYLEAFRQGLQRFGWVEGRNIRIETRWGALDDVGGETTVRGGNSRVKPRQLRVKRRISKLSATDPLILEFETFAKLTLAFTSNRRGAVQYRKAVHLPLNHSKVVRRTCGERRYRRAAPSHSERVQGDAWDRD